MAAPSLKLYTYPGNFRAFKALIAAEYNHLDVEIPAFEMLVDNKTPEFLAKNPLGKVPMLETEQGCIFESNAIARYLARIRRDTELYGASFFESGQIDSWVDFCTHEVELPATVWTYPVLGFMPFNSAATEKAKADLARALSILEAHLTTRTYLVGEKITLADIVVASALVYPFKLVMDGEYRKPFTCVTRWFQTCCGQAQFTAVLGEVPLCRTMAKAVGDNSTAAAPAAAAAAGGKKEKAAKAPKAAAAPAAAAPAVTEEEEEPKPEKKAKHPLAVMDEEARSPFVMDTWKKCYSNCGGNYAAAMTEFWTMFDAQGYSLWTCMYKYNNENTKMFMTCNKVSGFLQRCDEIRKWAFGTMVITGEEGGAIEVHGCFLLRSQSVEHMLNANPDAEHYDWTKIDVSADAGKAVVSEYWTAEDRLQGKVLSDSKVFK